MPKATYRFLIDLADNGSWAGVNDNVSAYVKQAEWQLGMARPFDLIARSASATLVLNNVGRQFSPESGSTLSGFEVGRAVKIDMTYPSNQNGVYSGPTLGKGGIEAAESAPLFDGTNDYVNVYNAGWVGSFNPSNGWIGVWVKVDDIATWTDGVLRVICRFAVNISNFVQIYKAATGEIVANHVAGATVKTVTSVVQSSADWIHILMRWVTDGPSSNLALFINGILIGTDSGLGTWAGTLGSTTCVLGALNTTTVGNPWKGYLAHASIASTASVSGVAGVASNPDPAALYAARSDYRVAMKNATRDNQLGYWTLGETGSATEAVNEVTQQTMFIGRIADIRPDPGTKGKRETVVTCEGYLSEVMDKEAFLPVLSSKRTDEVIAALIKAAKLYPPGFRGWIIGLSGYSEISRTTVLRNGVAAYAQLEEGKYTFRVFGDNLNAARDGAKKASIYSAMKMAVEAEQGRLFETRRGRISFWNRHHLAVDLITPLDVTLTDSVIRGIEYYYGKTLLNDLVMTVHPRTIGTSTVTLGTLDKALRIEAGETKSITITFRDDSGNRIGGKDLVSPMAHTDWTANSAEDGSGTDLTSSFSVSMTDGGDRVSWRVTNSSGIPGYLEIGATQRGTKITDFGDVDIAYQDDASVREYRRHPGSLNLKALEDLDYADNLTRSMVYRRREPRGEIESVELKAFKSDSLMKAALRLTMGDRGQFSETQTGASGQYFIVGEKHVVGQAREHTCTWIVEPAPPVHWILGRAGYSNVGTSTRVGV